MEEVSLGKLQKYFLCERGGLELAVCVGNGGQSFSWTVMHPDCMWANIIAGRLVILATDDQSVHYFADGRSVELEQILNNYFRLDVDLDELYANWCQMDPKLAGRTARRRSVRIISQDPFETFISFLCSQNNGIARISKMVHSLKNTFGKVKYRIVAEDGNNYDIHEFPGADKLAGQEALLRELGFGYRAEYISKSCSLLLTKPKDYFEELRRLPYEAVVEELLGFPGVGPKVADCIALFGMGKLESVPIDTHILKVAAQYNFKPPTHSLTRNSYKFIGDAFRKLYGPFAGWAHSILFSNQLRSFNK